MVQFLIIQELVVPKDLPFFVLLDITVHREPCFQPSTSVPWGHGTVKVGWRLKESVRRVHGAGTVWPALQRQPADATLDIIVLKVNIVMYFCLIIQVIQI